MSYTLLCVVQFASSVVCVLSSAAPLSPAQVRDARASVQAQMGERMQLVVVTRQDARAVGAAAAAATVILTGYVPPKGYWSVCSREFWCAVGKQLYIQASSASFAIKTAASPFFLVPLASWTANLLMPRRLPGCFLSSGCHTSWQIPPLPPRPPLPPPPPSHHLQAGQREGRLPLLRLHPRRRALHSDCTEKV